jgi:hypothetical protein
VSGASQPWRRAGSSPRLGEPKPAGRRATRALRPIRSCAHPGWQRRLGGCIRRHPSGWGRCGRGGLAARPQRSTLALALIPGRGSVRPRRRPSPALFRPGPGWAGPHGTLCRPRPPRPAPRAGPRPWLPPSPRPCPRPWPAAPAFPFSPTQQQRARRDSNPQPSDP